MKHLIFILALLGSVAGAGAEPWKECFDQAARTYAVPASLLRAVAWVESSMNPDALRAGASSRDVGVMQINSFWFDRLGMSEQDLMDPCTNIHVGAWILAQAIAREGYTWNAIGAYHAGHAPARQERRERYARKVARFLSRMEEK